MGKDFSENIENSTCYEDDSKIINQWGTETNNIFFYNVAIDIEINIDNDLEPRSIDEYRKKKWLAKIEKAVQTVLNSLLKKWGVWATRANTWRDKTSRLQIGVCKNWNENNKVIRYKVRVVTQEFSQMLNIDYEKTYSFVMNGIAFQFLTAMVGNNKLEM